MRRKLILIISLFFLSQLFSKTIHALTLTSDPQYIVMDFADIILLDWAAPEDTWQNEIKPKILTQLRQYIKVMPRGSDFRRLAWCTLQEYMNHPLDTPSTDSYYVVKMRRILEIAEEINLPVFMPLNGFQWWDELPELYNWWDPDGSNTPTSFFQRQRTKDFKDRFIKGYDPENIWNVEWLDYETPMSLNWRDWGGGGFRLAPPPNLVNHNHNTKYKYQEVLKSRLTVMLKELINKLNQWEKEGKSDLFAGISIGSEISLNASATANNEFVPYGFRAIQDVLCPENDLKCGINQDWSSAKLQQTREQIAFEYLNDLTALAVNLGIPKQRIYTHIWSEAIPGEARYTNYVPAAFNLYSRPGMSFYRYGENPLQLNNWRENLQKSGWPTWGAMEYSPDKDWQIWTNGLNNTFNNRSAQAQVIVMYNWAEHKDTAAIDPLKSSLLQKQPVSFCQVPEILPVTPNRIDNPTKFSWSFLNSASSSASIEKLVLHISKGIKVKSVSDSTEYVINSNSAVNMPIPLISPGVYTWFIEVISCQDKKQNYSAPQIFTVPNVLPPDTTPFWVKWLMLWIK